MPGNEPGDRVHNFFAQDRLFQQSQAAEDRGEDGFSSQFKYGPNFTQSSLRPHFVKGANELQPNMNSFGYGNMFHQSGLNEESLSGMGMSSRGLPFPGLQPSVPNFFANSSVSSETPLSTVGFDLFNAQQQTIHQQSSMPQFLQPQLSGNNDVRTLHQQLMSRRLQELQGQQQFDSRQHHLNQSTLVNMSTGSDLFQYPSSAADGSNWIYQSSNNMGGSSDRLGYQPNTIQTQQFDQSFYGVPVSSSRRLPVASDSHLMPDRSSIPQPQMPVTSSYRNDQYNLLTDQVQIASSMNAAGLDPEEKMFLFSSDDNIRDAFEAVPRISEEVNIFGDGGLSNSLAGSWSALMQSSDAETSGNATPKEFGLSFNGNNGPAGREQLLNSSLLQTSAASLNPNQAGLYTDTLTPSGLSSGWNTPSMMLPSADRLNNPDAEKLKHSLLNRQAALMQGSVSSIWKQNPALTYDTELGHLNSGHSKGINDLVAQSHNPPRSVNANSFVQNNSLLNQWRSAQHPASSQGGKSLQKLQDPVLGSMSSHDGDKTDKCEIEKHDRKENPSERHHSSLHHHSPHGYKEVGQFNENDPRSLSSGRQNSSNQLPVKVSAPRKFRYHPMGNADENMVTEHNLQQPSRARAMPQPNALFGRSNLFNQAAMYSSDSKKGQSRELPGDANDADNKSSGRNPSHQAPTVPTFISQNMLELLHKVDQEKDRTSMTQTMSSVQQGFGLHLDPSSQRLQLSQGGKTSSPLQLSRNVSSAFMSGIPNSQNHLQSQQLTVPRVQKSINSSGQHQLVQSQTQPSPYENIWESSSASSMEGVSVTEHKWKESTNLQLESVSTDCVPEVKGSVGQELALENHFKNSPANSISMLEEIKDLGSSQTQALRNADIDVINNEGPKSFANAPASSLKAGVVDIVPISGSQLGNIVLQDGSVLGSTVFQSQSYSDRAASARVEYLKGDHQMAPPWSSSYGSLKSGQVLQIHDAHKVNIATSPGEHVVASEINRSSPTSAADITGQHSVHLGYKKRKNDTFRFQPWRKEISDDSRYLKIHSSAAEADLSKSIKRVSGKVDDIAGPMEDASPVLRAKKRLLTSSRLMQQLIGPLPAKTLSVDALSSYDVVPYSTSRIVLGDACHAVSSASNMDGSIKSFNPPLEKPKSLSRNGAQRHEMASKELADRVMAIKEKLPSLEKSASSLLELRTEFQDLEKHTICNRIQEILVRGQAVNSETASAITSTRKPSLQRLVQAAPMTKDIPADVQCLSL